MLVQLGKMVERLLSSIDLARLQLQRTLQQPRLGVVGLLGRHRAHLHQRLVVLAGLGEIACIAQADFRQRVFVEIGLEQWLGLCHFLIE